MPTPPKTLRAMLNKAAASPWLSRGKGRVGDRADGNEEQRERGGLGGAQDDHGLEIFLRDEIG